MKPPSQPATPPPIPPSNFAPPLQALLASPLRSEAIRAFRSGAKIEAVPPLTLTLHHPAS